MLVQVPTARRGLDVELPDDATTVVTSRHSPAVADPVAALRAALRTPVAGPPLRDHLKAGEKTSVAWVLIASRVWWMSAGSGAAAVTVWSPAWIWMVR